MSLSELIPAAWKDTTRSLTKTASFSALTRFIAAEYAQATVYPRRVHLFRALALTSPGAVKAVILGQDPYHGKGQAEGLCFSVPDGVRFPPSLRNIFSELQSDLGHPPPSSGSLVPWAKQGVLLLNATLSVREGSAASHAGRGWEEFTDGLIARLSAESARAIVFILWGKSAAGKACLINRDRHPILASPHPSPLSARRGFFGSKPFSRTNALLKAGEQAPVDWSLPHQQQLRLN